MWYPQPSALLLKKQADDCHTGRALIWGWYSYAPTFALLFIVFNSCAPWMIRIGHLKLLIIHWSTQPSTRSPYVEDACTAPQTSVILDYILSLINLNKGSLRSILKNLLSLYCQYTPLLAEWKKISSLSLNLTNILFKNIFRW